jgi:hypothetical protein
VVADDAVNDAEAEPRPLGLGREERVEDGSLVAEADARVGDVDLDAAANVSGPDGEAPTFSPPTFLSPPRTLCADRARESVICGAHELCNER